MTHLSSTDLGTSAGSGAARYPLIGDGSDLLIIRKTSAWDGQQLVVTPIDERYLTAVTYGNCSTYDVRPTSAYEDGDIMVARLKAMRARTTTSQWATGHKYMFNYCARSFGPYIIRYVGDNNINNLLVPSLEFGTVFSALKFNLHALPVGKCTAFRAWWRVWNPSTIHCAANDPGIGMSKSWYAYTYLYDNASKLCYHFDADLCAPSQCVADGHGVANIPGVSNRGNGNGVSVNVIQCDPFGSHLATTSTTSYYGRQQTYAFKNSNNTNPYYSDVEITGDALSALKGAIRLGRFWVHCGFTLGNLCAEAGHGACMLPYSTFFTQFTRLELVLSLSMPTFNYP